MADVDARRPVLTEAEQRYRQRLARYITALRNERPDMVPIRPFVAEFTGVHAGYDCQELAHDYRLAFEAACRCAVDFDWDAVVANMVYVWTGLTQALGLKYYAIPGIDIPPNMGFQYREPPNDAAFMRAEEYDALIADPCGFLLNVWLPRVSTEIIAPGSPATSRHALALIKGGMAMMDYFQAFGPQVARLRQESGTVSAIAGIFKAPMDILADKLRGYLGLVEDLHERREKVVAACEALMPHLTHVARTTADPARLVPIGYWMHRGGVPFVSPEVFQNVYWSTVKPIIEELWRDGHQTLFYAEGKWDRHLESFGELPERSIVFHVDRGDLRKTVEILGPKFCISGGISNTMLATGTPQQVREHVREVLSIAARDGGYILDASAIVQNDARDENMRAMTDAAREFGVYSEATSWSPDIPRIAAEQWQPEISPPPPQARYGGPRPGVCIPWEQQRQSLPDPIPGSEPLARRVWEQVDSLAYSFLWQVLLSF
jgi:hypothetical protein